MLCLPLLAILLAHAPQLAKAEESIFTAAKVSPFANSDLSTVANPNGEESPKRRMTALDLNMIHSSRPHLTPRQVRVLSLLKEVKVLTQAKAGKGLKVIEITVSDGRYASPYYTFKIGGNPIDVASYELIPL
jgi:hypothetical protein